MFLHFLTLSVDLMACAGTCKENTDLIKTSSVILPTIPERIFRGFILLHKHQINHSTKLEVKPK